MAWTLARPRKSASRAFRKLFSLKYVFLYREENEDIIINLNGLTLRLQIPSTTVPGQYRLRVEGNTDRALGGTAFLNETILNFSQRSMTIFIQTEKPVYHQSQIGKLHLPSQKKNPIFRLTETMDDDGESLTTF